MLAAKMSHTHLSTSNSNQKLRIYEMDTKDDNNALSDIASKYVIARKGTETPKFVRKYVYTIKPKYNNDSLEDDHSRKSSMGSVGDGIQGGEKGVINTTSKGGLTTYSPSHFTVPNGRRFSCTLQGSPGKTIQEILPGNPWTHTLKNSNHLVLRSTMTSAFSPTDTLDSTVPKSTNVYPKSFSSVKRSQFVSPHKSVSVDECHSNGYLYEGNSSSDSSKRTSQNSLLQLPASNGYKVRTSNHTKR